MARFARLVLPTAFLLCQCALQLSLACADDLDQAAIESLLKREVIGPQVALTEVQAFAESRVPLMPELSDRDKWEAYAAELRARVLSEVVFRGEAASWRDAKTGVEWGDTIDAGPDYRIRKVRYEALPGLWIPALLYEPLELSGKCPVVLNVNGHDGTGKAAPYKQIRCINQARRGMIALNVEWLGMGQLRGSDYAHYRMNQLDLCGTSGVAPYYLAMKRGIDLLLSHENADPKRVGVAGLSGGGWQTIFISSLDTRVAFCNPVAGYSSFRTRARHFKDLGDSEQTPCDLATVADYTHLTALLAPRAALLTFNSKDDCCFESGYALPPLLEAAKPVYELLGQPERLRSHVNDDPGTHNFGVDNRQALYRALGDYFYAESEFDAAEIPSDDQVRSFDELQVTLPEHNASFHSLALELSKELPRDADLPEKADAAGEWQRDQRKLLREIVAWHDYELTADKIAEQEVEKLHVNYWRLKIGSEWTIPMVELAPEGAKRTAMVIGDGGRSATAPVVQELVQSGARVLAVDPFYFGESKIASHDNLFALLVAAVGERPLGIQASQVAVVARWSHTQQGESPITVVAVGPRTSTMALVAAALETEAIVGVELRDSLGSLKEVIEQNHAVNEMPEMFCFGLLERFDTLQLAALVAPRPVTLHKASERARSELAPLADWYKLLGAEHDPVP